MAIVTGPDDATDPPDATDATGAPAGAFAYPADWLARLDLGGTIAFLVVTVAAGIVGDDAAAVNLIACAVLFVVGSAIWAWGFVLAAARSRDEVLDLAGLFYLTGSAPRPARRWFLGLWFAQIAIAVAAIPLTSPPFGVMVPVFGIGIITLWAATRGTFPERPVEAGPRGRRSAP